METSWPTFVLVVLAAYVVPGPDLAVILRSATRGRRAGFAAAAGAQTGLCVHMLLAVVGLSVVLARHPDALTVVRVLGGAYLLYLGGRLVAGTLRRDRPPVPTGADPRSAFVQGLLTNLLNPKAVLFFASVLPQFVVPGSVPTGVQVAVLGAVDIVLGVLPWTVVVLVGARLSTLLARRRVRDWWDRVTGTALGGLGAGLLAKG
jgi:threonine/homoserine/homoserine lactone efflux protein